MTIITNCVDDTQNIKTHVLYYVVTVHSATDGILY